MIDRRQFAEEEERAEAVILGDIAEIEIALGADELSGLTSTSGIGQKYCGTQPMLNELS
jgi:hypothetical protein